MKGIDLNQAGIDPAIMKELRAYSARDALWKGSTKPVDTSITSDTSYQHTLRDIMQLMAFLIALGLGIKGFIALYGLSVWVALIALVVASPTLPLVGLISFFI